VGLFSVIRLMRIARVLGFLALFGVFTFIEFVCVVEAIRFIIMLREYAKELEASRSS
jgi:hypothetical protein